MTTFTNCYASDTLVPGGYYRVGVQRGLVDLLDSDAGRNSHFQDVYNGISKACPLVPNMPYSFAPGDTAMVIDCTAAQNAATMTCAGAAGAINGISFEIGIVSFDKLAAAPSVNAPAERAAVVAAIQNAPSAVGSIFDSLSGFGDTVKYALIAIAVVIGVVLLKDVSDEW